MATSFGTSIPTVVVYRVRRDRAIVRVRVHIGETGGQYVGELALRPSEFHAWRRTLRDFAPDRFSIWYAEGAFEWLQSVARQEVEGVL